jgi:Fur family ferric uptake transcriptional regulator
MLTVDHRLSQLLTSHKLRPTPVRVAILQVLVDSPFALSGHEIEQLLPPPTDRITMYRTLKFFEAQGLIHQVLDTTSVIRYAACSIECSAHEHFDNHVHFKCTSCQRIYCLKQVPIPHVSLPHQFEAHTRDYLLVGTCRTCQPT